MKNRPRTLRTRPLLLASAGLSVTLALQGCPYGNLMDPDCTREPEYCDSPDAGSEMDLKRPACGSRDGGALDGGALDAGCNNDGGNR